MDWSRRFRGSRFLLAFAGVALAASLTMTAQAGPAAASPDRPGAVLMSAAALSAMPVLASPAQAASGYGPIYNYGAGTCLDDPGSSRSSGTQMDSWGCNGGSNQQWREYSSKLVDNQFWFYMFQNEASGLCLDLRGGSKNDGTPVIQYPCNTADNAQYWQLGSTPPNYAPPWWDFTNLAGTVQSMVITSDSKTWGAKIESWKVSIPDHDTTHWWDPSGGY
jgi:Ricin-type beta-trefoil lectin domain-like